MNSKRLFSVMTSISDKFILVNGGNCLGFGCFSEPYTFLVREYFNHVLAKFPFEFGISQQDNFSMLQSNSAGGEDNPDFKWGAKRGVGRKDNKVRFYESFTLEGIEYRLFDCAYFYRFLGEYEPQWDELFLACGDEKGVSNINDVETIMGKCNVVCTSDDRRNPRPGTKELRRAKYIFSRTFDTRLRIISEDFADAIAGIGVDKLFNMRRDKQPVKRLNSSAAAITRASPVKSFRPDLGSTKLGKHDNRDAKLMSRTSSLKKVTFLEDRADHVHVKRNPPVNTETTTRGQIPILKTRAFGELYASGSSVNAKPSKKRKLILNTPETDDSDDQGPQSGEKKLIKNPPLVEKAPSQNIEKKSWYKKLPFEDELKPAIEKGRVLLIENLEPSYTSLEVEFLFRQAFKEGVDAKMIPSSPMSSPHSGRALVIFGTTKAADSAMSRLNEDCLMLSGQRALTGSKNVPVEIGRCRSFTGHFNMVDRSLMTAQKPMPNY
ncbi:RNA recognition motif domain [Arabidopsis thaliana x Arabidopsis arenosa]|uniref:RNA recognition motif domain n=1 Tax=Arabidopsis thaliana x Arabidopsis arenosa TaxID=1240361 RepID=A0A8T2EN35_9BRAS|nr:RNA recognition motif domain [Arabidopsis thaliana x Arabidopsis arenosa]